MLHRARSFGATLWSGFRRPHDAAELTFVGTLDDREHRFYPSINGAPAFSCTRTRCPSLGFARRCEKSPNGPIAAIIRPFCASRLRRVTERHFRCWRPRSAIIHNVAMKSRRRPKGLGDHACGVCISSVQGSIVGQSAGNRKLAGTGYELPCWRLHMSIEGISGLPCHEECAQELLRCGKETTSEVMIHGRAHQLCCMPVVGKIISVLFPVDSPLRASNTGASNTGASNTAGDPHLTPREIDVLHLLAQGHAAPAIAEQLGIGPSTARAHVENMRRKLGVKTQAALVAVGFRHGYLH